jgi:hypothetical protein
MSTWNLNDQRGGIGVEELDERVHPTMCWWTNCITDYLNHIRLPRLATSIAAPAPRTSSGFNNIISDGGTFAKWADNTNIDDDDTGTYATCTASTNGWGDYITGTKSAAISTCAIKIYFAYINHCTAFDIDVSNGGSSWTSVTNDYTPVAGKWLSFAITPASYDRVRVRCYFDAAGTATLCELVMVESANGTAGTPAKFAYFNSNWYMASGAHLSKLNTSTGAAWIPVAVLPASITDMAVFNSTLVILLGDSDNYWYMSTSEVCIQTNVARYWCLAWNALFCTFTQAGVCTYSATPNAATPSYSAYGSLTDVSSSDTRHPFIYQDSYGNDIIYWPTNTVLYAHDADTPAWLATKVKLSGHANGAKGAVFYQDSAYIPEGLSVKKYTVGSTASLTDEGLDKYDGLPIEYNGEITYMFEGAGYLFALVDASQVSGTAKSGLYAYKDGVWKCWWIDTSNDQAMTCGGVSSVYEYRVWWNVGTTVYYIPLHRGIQNPARVSQTYNASGVWISGWFNAGSAAADKLAHAINSYCKSITASETVIIKYRTNHTYTDLDTGWTTVDTLNAAGDNGTLENVLGSNAGVSFNAIQLRLDFARGGTTTLSPDCVLSLSYEKKLPVKYRWTFTVNAHDVHKDKSPKQQIDSLETAAETGTLVAFTFRDGSATADTHYVEVESFRAKHETGRGFEGRYVVSVVEP